MKKVPSRLWHAIYRTVNVPTDCQTLMSKDNSLFVEVRITLLSFTNEDNPLINVELAGLNIIRAKFINFEKFAPVLENLAKEIILDEIKKP